VSTACAAHPEREAAFRCSGCSRTLCPDCIEEGHRLLFCRHCRERALPLVEGAAATTTELARERRFARPYPFAHAFTYVFRGRGTLTLPAYVALLTFAEIAPPMVRLAIYVLVALILPGFLFEIVRRTAEADDELPDWPDYSEVGARLADWRDAAGVALAAWLPWLALRRFVGCDLEDFLIADRGLCALAAAIAAAIGFAVAQFGFGAVGTWDSGWLSFRLDLHLEALLSGTKRDGPLFLGTIAILLAGAGFVARLLIGVPLLGMALIHAALGYALFTSAHLAGLLFRRHRERLEAIYLR
jgi:hypothetical protein